MFKLLISVFSGCVFAATYFLSPHELRSQYSSIALTIALLVEIVIKQFFLGGIKGRTWGVYLIILAFTIPSIIFNDLVYIQIKFFVFKFLFLAVVIWGHYSNKFNIMEFSFNAVLSKLVGPISDNAWRTLNFSFIIYLVFATFGALAMLMVSESAWVFFKGVVLGIVSLFYIAWILWYGYKQTRLYKNQNKQ